MAQNDTCYTRWENLQILNKLDSFSNCKQVLSINERRVRDLLQSRDDAVKMASNCESVVELHKRTIKECSDSNTKLQSDITKEQTKTSKWRKGALVASGIGCGELALILLLILL